MSLRDVATLVLLVLGVGLEAVAALGVAVMRDALDRLHYVGLAGFGGLLVGLAIITAQGFSLIGDKALMTGAFLVLAGPVLVHTTARSLLTRAAGDWRNGIERRREEERS